MSRLEPMSSLELGDWPTTLVVVAHGPAAATLTAVRNVASWSRNAHVVVVAGTEPGLTAVDRVADRGFDTQPGHGPTALTQALRAFHGVVAVVHDDTSLNTEALSAMFSAHRTTGKVAVAPTEASVSQEMVEQAVVHCALGSADQLRALADASAFGPGITTAGEFVQPANVSVNHSAGCQQRLVETGAIETPLLVAALIVRDESEHLAACLASLAGIVDRIEVADTGSLDDTVEIARSAGAEVVEIGWREDFAWARNQVLERCTDATYMLWIDADERLVCDDPAQLRRVLATYASLSPAYQLTINNQNDQGVETHSFLARRIVNPTLVRFEGALHEQAVRLDGAPLADAVLASLSLTHLGYEDSIMEGRRKAERNLQIARQGYVDDPGEAQAIHLARALRGASDDPVNTLDELEPLLAHVSEENVAGRSLIHALRAELHLEASQLPAAANEAQMALDLIPADATAGAVLAESLYRTGRYTELLDTAADYARRPSPAPFIDDTLAARTKARLIFEAAVHLERFEVAIAQLGHLSTDVDPWLVLAATLPIDEFADLAELAGSLDDERHLRALVALPQLCEQLLGRAVDAFGRTDVSTDMATLIDEVAANLSAVNASPQLLTAWEQSGSLPDAVAFARQLTNGHPDLAIMLDDVEQLPHPVAAAFALTAEADHRRGRTEEAQSNAKRSLALWPAAGRAVVVLAQVHRSNGRPNDAITLVETARKDPDYSTNNSSVRRSLAIEETHAHLELGHLGSAASAAVDIVEHGGTISMWHEMLQLADTDMDELTLVLGLAMLTDGTGFIDALPAAVGPHRTPGLCATYLGLGGTNADAVSVGLLAAALTGQDDLGVLIAGHGALLPDDVRDRLADHLSTEGATSAAAALLAKRTTPLSA